MIESPPESPQSMRVPTIGVIALSVALGLGIAPVPATARVATAQGMAPAEKSQDDEARALYAAGEREYLRGRFREALEKFEKAYDLSGQPLLLYNIALAYSRLYEVAKDLEELRRGRAVLNNFMMFAARDPELDAADAKKLLEEIEALIAAHEEADPGTAVETNGDPPLVPDDAPRTPTGEDPGRVLRIGGAVAMGVGGVLLVGGTIGGIVYSIKGREFSDEIERLRTETPNACAEGDDAIECQQNGVDIDTARDNGRKANLGVGLSFGIGGGLGLIGLATGVVLFVQGNRRTREWKAGTAAAPRLQVWPTLTRRGMGLAGRF